MRSSPDGDVHRLLPTSDFGNTSIQFENSGSHSTNALCASRLQIRSSASGQFQYIEMTEKDYAAPSSCDPVL